MADCMLTWLRATIDGAKAAAEAADAASPGPWINTGQDGDGDAWQIHGAPTGETRFEFDPDSDEPNGMVEVPVRRQVATLNYSDGGGVWTREAADHIVLQQPLDTIARCDADLWILDRVVPEIRKTEVQNADEFGGGWPDNELTPDVEELIRTLAYGYRRRPGWNPDWAPEGITP